MTTQDMSDRELLELAAKAAGYQIDQRATFMTWRDSKCFALLNVKCGHDLWNPLADDGDALRLAVKLELIVDTHGSHVQVSYPFDTPLAFEKIGDDPCAATRLAITRAAAEIGKAMRASQ